MSAQEKKTCLVCGQTFEKTAGFQFDMCPSCLKKMGDRYAASQEASGPPAPRKRTALWVVLAISVAVNLAQIPRIKKALALIFPPPEDVSKRADPRAQCVANLWNVSALIQKDQWPSQDILCPAANTPYRTQKTDKGDLVVSCPNPAAHGLKALYVSKKSPAPVEEPLVP